MSAIFQSKILHWLADRADVVDWESRLSTTVVGVGIGHPSLSILPVIPSNTARFQSVELLGQITSHVPCPHVVLITLFWSITIPALLLA